MRPDILNPLFADLAALKGVGPKLREHFAELAGPRIADLLWHFPRGIADRGWRPKVAELAEGKIATLRLSIGKHQKPPRRGLPYRITAFDDTGKITLVFFNARESYLTEALPEGEQRIVSGKVELYGKAFQMIHPDYVLKIGEAASLPETEPLYPLTAGLTQRVVLKTAQKALDTIPALPEWMEPTIQTEHGWPSWREAIKEAHAPKTTADLDANAPPRRRLAYDELLANELTLHLVRAAMRRKKGRTVTPQPALRQKALRALPFQLTGDQETALAEIEKDMAAPFAMLRLLQGDVGAGKTVVAFLAMLNAAGSGAQAALLAPTEILARQHFETLAPWAAAAGVSLALLTGRDQGAAREKLLGELVEGKIQILVGTHALFQEDVAYRDLGLVVVDEQHRFGVFQRLALARKGALRPDMLVMTATPIPRTLTLSYYGDMDVSRLEQKPPGRKRVDTRVISLERLTEVEAGLKRALARGERAFWVTPLIEEGGLLPFTAVEARFKRLQKIFGDDAGLVHGRLKAPQKDKVMEAFVEGRIKVLAATTVVEVGVDVSEATVMVIENAERFGLAQLHQLRGRVGRSGQPSYCLLLHGKNLTSAARARLAKMRATDNGFEIAEEDLRLRGAGEILGTRQSGLPEFRVADLEAHGDLLELARDDARLTLARDPKLQAERGQRLKVLLYLFERDEAVGYLESG